jgi:hypothetical protein
VIGKICWIWSSPKSKRHYPLHVFASLFLLLSCSARTHVPADGALKQLPFQRDPRIIKVEEPWDASQRQYSGAAIYHDSVVLLPQYPAVSGNQIPMFPLANLLAPDADKNVQKPQLINFDDDGLSERISGFEGFEAIAFLENDVFVTIESHRPGGMMGYLVRGSVSGSGTSLSIHLDSTSLTELPPLAHLSNMSDEAIVALAPDRLLTFYEANGVNVSRHPHAYLFDVANNGIKKLGDISISPIEYRITDCSPADPDGIFWCINWMYPGDEAKLKPARDRIAEHWKIDTSVYGGGKGKSELMERLIQLKFDGSKIHPADHPPIYLKLRSDGLPRNWESIAFIPGLGFFLATDHYPETIFAFVPL